VTIHLNFHGPLRNPFGAGEVTLAAADDIATIGDLLRVYVRLTPAEARHIIVLRNDTEVRQEEAPHDGDTLTLLLPVGGG